MRSSARWLRLAFPVAAQVSIIAWSLNSMESFESQTDMLSIDGAQQEEAITHAVREKSQ